MIYVTAINMSSSFYDSFTNPDINSDWANDVNGFDSSAYMFDSPQPENQTLPLGQESNPGQDPSGAQRLAAPNSAGLPTQGKRQSHIAVPQDPTSQPSSVSEASSHSSSSPSVVKRQAASASPTANAFQGNQPTSHNPQGPTIKSEEGLNTFDAGNVMMGSEDTLFQGMDTNMNMEMDNLSLQPGTSFDFSAADTSDALTSGMLGVTGEDFSSTGFAPASALETEVS